MTQPYSVQVVIDCAALVWADGAAICHPEGNEFCLPVPAPLS
jgi:hypothetical protein